MLSGPVPIMVQALFVQLLMSSINKLIYNVRRRNMKKKRLPFHQLVKKNKEELMKDKSVIEKIEKKLEEKYADSIKSQQAI